MSSNDDLKHVVEYVPDYLLTVKKSNAVPHMYLANQKLAKSIAAHVLPYLWKNKDQVICETNAGFGFISKELLDCSVNCVRIYESCPQFRGLLKVVLIFYLYIVC